MTDICHQCVEHWTGVSFSITCVVSPFCVCVSALVCPAQVWGKRKRVTLLFGYFHLNKHWSIIRSCGSSKDLSLSRSLCACPHGGHSHRGWKRAIVTAGDVKMPQLWSCMVTMLGSKKIWRDLWRRSRDRELPTDVECYSNICFFKTLAFRPRVGQSVV